MLMLLTTHTGIVVNSDHIAYIGLKKDAPPRGVCPTASATHRVILCLGTGDSVIAARNLPLPAARFVRKDIAHHWETGKAHWHASTSLDRHASGAYFATESEANNG